MNVLPDSMQLERFRAALEQLLGLRFDDTKLAWLGDVLQRRAGTGGPGAAMDGSALGEYHARERYLAWLEGLAGGAAPAALRGEVAALALELTVGETYFFRNAEQFRALRECCVPQRLRSGTAGTALRVLSAGCASGDEPYSIAMTLHAALPADRRLIIHAIDVNAAALEKARQGLYSAWSLRDTPADLRERWFRMHGGTATLDESIRAAVHFEERNLVRLAEAGWPAASFDVVFCRNVLMYFATPVATSVVQQLARLLAPGGYLFLGHAETLRGLSHDFDLCHTHDTFYYQRRRAQSHAAGPAAVAAGGAIPGRIGSAVAQAEAEADWFASIGRATERVRALTTPAGHTDAAEAWQFGQPLDQWGLEPSPDVPQPESDSTQMGLLFEGSQLGTLPERWDFGLDPVSSQLDRAIDLFRHERFAEALRLVEGLPVSTDDPQLPLLRAMLLVHTSQFDAAEAACTALLSDDSLNPGAHYVRALCREGVGDAAGAAECDQVAAHLDPAFAMPHLHLGLLARRNGDRATVRHELGQALALLTQEDASRLLLFGGGFTREALVALCRSELKADGAGR